jgi:hypothetical protein
MPSNKIGTKRQAPTSSPQQIKHKIHLKSEEEFPSLPTHNKFNVLSNTSNTESEIDMEEQTIHQQIVNSNDTPSQQETENSKYTVYMTGKQNNIIKDFGFQKASDFQKAINAICGQVESVSIASNSFRIIVTSIQQQHKLLATTSILDTEVTVTLPNSMLIRPYIPTPKPQPKPFLHHGVIKIPTDVTEAEIKDATNASYVRRIHKRHQDDYIPTVAVVLAFPQPLPNRIQIGLLSLLVHEYQPTPRRCNLCQKFGHTTNKCHQSIPTCPQCSGPHSYDECNNSPADAKCPNCKQQHNAAYKGCQSYIQAKQVITYATKNGVTYRDALKATKQPQINNQLTETTIPKQQIIKTDASTQTEKDTATQTEVRTILSTDHPINNEHLTHYIQASADAIYWLLTQIPVSNQQRTLMNPLIEQFRELTNALLGYDSPDSVDPQNASNQPTPPNTTQTTSKPQDKKKTNTNIPTKQNPGARPKTQTQQWH